MITCSPRMSSAIALLSVLLAACGAAPSPLAQAPHTLSAQALPLASKVYLLTVKITSTSTTSSLATTYPGSTLLSFRPAEGYALLAVDSYKASANILVAEKNAKMKGGVVGAQGFSTWAGGFSLWAGGFSLWAGGTTTATSFSENAPIWNLIQLSSAQALVPELGKGVKVAVIDSGLDLTHPALSGKLDLANARDFVDGDTLPQDVNPSTDGTYAPGYGHGTAVAGVILQVAPNATILPLRVLGPDGSGDVANVIAAIDHAVASGAKVINLSLGGSVDIKALNSAISSANNVGTMVISSSGNTGDTNVTYPAANALGSGGVALGQVSVGSVSTGLTKSAFSTHGTLEMTAVGEQVKTLFPGGQTVSASGTSFAAPMTAGAAALALSTYGTAPFSPTQANAISSRLLKNLVVSTQPNQDATYNAQLGSGTLNTFALVHLYR